MVTLAVIVQVVDVREKYELDLASLKEVDVVELPLSESAKWGPAISEKLDANRTIFCLVCESRVS